MCHFQKVEAFPGTNSKKSGKIHKFHFFKYLYYIENIL